MAEMHLPWAALADFAGPFIFGVAVAKTIGSGIAIPEFITIEVLVAALVSACIWNLVTWYFGIPSSSSHALIGGLVVPYLLVGVHALLSKGLIKIFYRITFFPLIGLFLAG
ncbi:MAG: inorganic phosphate transporter [Chitinophagaceae bacterium]|nr:inorganic phosphate transporter [Chitinophagaceae bacterium]